MVKELKINPKFRDGVNAVATMEKQAAQPGETGEQESEAEEGSNGNESESQEQPREAPGHAQRRNARKAARR